MLASDLKDILRAFKANAVEYLVIGGHTFGVYAEPRAAKDLDLFIQSNPENVAAVFKALAQYGAPLADFADGSAFQIGQPPDRIDILQSIDGVTFEDAWNNRLDGMLDDDIPVHVISRENLIRNKLASGRPQDILDAEILRSSDAHRPSQKE